MGLRLLLLAGLCVVAGRAHAGLFSDEEAHNKIQQLDVRISRLEESNKQQAETVKQQTQSMLDLQTQIETQVAELRRLRGQLEELTHGLQEAEGRQKDFYVDLDTRVRHFETAAEAAATKETPVPATPVATPPLDPSDPAQENRAFEAAYDLFRGGNHANAVKAFQEFLSGYPDSVHIPNAQYWLAKNSAATQ